MSDIAKIRTQILRPNDYIFSKGELTINQDILPLHPNQRLLYETILQLSPSSVIELGCGSGDHLKNLNTLNPDIQLYGREISNEQIKLLKKRHPNLDAKIEQIDITLPYPFNTPNVDIAFTHAVIMHFHTGKSHLVALSNLFRYAKKQVILMENWLRHSFMQDIEFLFLQHVLPWQKIYFYYRESKEFKRPHIMVIFSEVLKDYPELTDYSILL
ncbi:methyltransferase domain-containing protein, partial [Thermodesulfobacteriota bacterium]